jgi:choline-sulfatase
MINFKTIVPTLVAGFSIATSLQAAKQPNILFIFADDHAYDAVGYAGNSMVKTPNLDKLAAEGVNFTHAYNSGAWQGAVCIASRTMMMTGKQVWNAHDANLKKMIEAKQFFPQIMADAGYDTYYAGKWHVGGAGNAKATWKFTKNVRPGMPNQTKERYQRKFIEGQPDTWSPYDEQFNGFWKGGKHWSEVLADDGTEFISAAAKEEKPFMMMLAFNAPHDPRQAPKEYQEMYPYEEMKVPANFQKNYPHNIGSNKIRDEQLAPFPRTPYSVQVNMSEYFALITHMDTQIGIILDELEKSGKKDDTIIIFSADHGLGCGQHGLLGKQNMYDHSVRVPWIIAGPGIPKGKESNTPISLQDAMATCIELAGAKKPSYVDFNSVLPIIKSGKSEKRDIYSCYTNFQRMVSDTGHKLIVYPQSKVEILYDLTKDPLEKKDVSKNPEYAPILKEMRAKLAAQMKGMNDPVDLSDPVESFKNHGKSARNKKMRGGH